MEKTIDPSIQGTTLKLDLQGSNEKKLYLESYGCAMNFSDSEVVASILASEGYIPQRYWKKQTWYSLILAL